MLHNPNWKSGPFSLPSLIGWLEKQPEKKTYNYVDGSACLLGQYLSDMGYQNVYVYSDHFMSVEQPFVRVPLSRQFHDIAIQQPHNFGAALKRARDENRSDNAA